MMHGEGVRGQVDAIKLYESVDVMPNNITFGFVVYTRCDHYLPMTLTMSSFHLHQFILYIYRF